jgi:hypothetical protein
MKMIFRMRKKMTNRVVDRCKSALTTECFGMIEFMLKNIPVFIISPVYLRESFFWACDYYTWKEKWQKYLQKDIENVFLPRSFSDWSVV